MSLNDLVGFLPSLGAYGANHLQNQYNMEQQYNYSRMLAEQQNSANLIMWHRNNAYNSPLQQMERLRAAGLNPQLAYGNQPQADSPAMVGGSTPASQASPLSGTDLQQAALLRAQRDNIQADTDLKRSQAGKTDEETKNIGFEQSIKQAEIEINKALADANIDLSQSQAKLFDEQVKETAERVESIKVDTAINRLNYNFLDKTFDDRCKMVKAELSKVNSEVAKNDAEVQRITTLLTAELDNLQASLKEINSRTDLNAQQRKNLINQNIVDVYKNYYLHMAHYHNTHGKGYRVQYDLQQHKLFVKGLFNMSVF